MCYVVFTICIKKDTALTLGKQFSDGTIHQSNLLGEGRAAYQTEKSTPSRCLVIRSQQFYVAPPLFCSSTTTRTSIHACATKKNQLDAVACYISTPLKIL